MRKHLLAGLATLTVLLVSLPGQMVAAAPRATGRAGVLAFRLVTFWLPIIPGYLAFRSLTQRDLL